MPPDGRVVQAFKGQAWWLKDYSELNNTLDSAKGQLTASYRSGPGGAAKVNLSLERGPGLALTLTIDSPPQALVTQDPRTGRMITSERRTVFTFRDRDLDGMPDEVLEQPKGEPLSREALAADGFMVIRDSADHRAYFVQWSIGMAFATNHFLHGKDSVYP